MANLTSKIYQIINKDSEELCVAILQFPEHTDVKHWTRIAEQLHTVIEDFAKQPHDVGRSTQVLRDAAVAAVEYISQHHDSGFTILLHCFEDKPDYEIWV